MRVTWGWDGGGTKTEVMALDEQGRERARGVFGPLNLNGAADGRVQATIKDAVGFMAAQPGGLDACAGLVIGAAGVSNGDAARLLEASVRQAGYQGPLRLAGDQEIALAGAIEGPGAVLIAGTGSICCGRNGDKVLRAGGFGYLIDDEGSGYAIGRDILAAVVRARDGRGPATVLTESVFTALDVRDIVPVISWLYAPDTGKKDVAALARLLPAAVAAQDEAARQIAMKAANALTELALTVWTGLGLQEGELALAGSILVHHDTIRRGVEQCCRAAYPQMRCIASRGSAAYGAAKMAAGL